MLTEISTFGWFGDHDLLSVSTFGWYLSGGVGPTGFTVAYAGAGFVSTSNYAVGTP